MTFWYEFKLFVEHASGISMDALHVLVGVLLQLIFAAAIKQPISRWRPWLLLLGVLLLNEASDLWVEQWPHLGMQLGEGAKDIALTMTLPTLLLLCVRARPESFAGVANPGAPG